jgi:hypothetical protein
MRTAVNRGYKIKDGEIMQKDYLSLSREIYRRKSIREYDDRAIDFLEDSTDLTKKFGLVPLFKDIRYKIVVFKNDEIKNIRSKYFIAFFSEEVDGGRENIGFIGQQLSLELQAIGIGTCWLGIKKPERKDRTADGLGYVLAMSAGYPKGEATRPLDKISRRDISEIALGEADEYIEAVRLAPSAVNNQPWAVEKAGDKYNFYLAKPKNFILGSILGDLRKIDMGIGMAHLFIKAKSAGKAVEINSDGQNLPNAIYVATLTLK